MTDIKIQHTFIDPETEATLDVDIFINEQGIEIAPRDEETKWVDVAWQEAPRAVWVEFYLRQLLAHLWDGTKQDPVTFQVAEATSPTLADCICEAHPMGINHLDECPYHEGKARLV